MRPMDDFQNIMRTFLALDLSLVKILPGPKSRSAVCRYCRPWPFTLLIYSYV